MSGIPQWSLYHVATVAPRVASFPGNAVSTLPPFVRLTAAGESEWLKTSVRRGASGDQIHISLATLPTAVNGAQCEFVASSKAEYRRKWHFRDPAMMRAFIGLSLALIGVVLDGALAVGKVTPIVRVSEAVIVATMITGFLLKAVGLILAFTAVYTSKD